MKTDVYDNKAKKVGTVDLPDRIFGHSWNPDLVHQAVRTQTANKRANIAHAKDRGESRGGGKKPWRQKGTGRARHGSIRSPIWRGGGVTHGPTKERVLSLKINKKMRQGAMFAILSRKLKDGDIKVVESLEIDEPKTGKLSEILSNFAKDKQNFLIIPNTTSKNLYQASRNLKTVKSLDPRSLNVYDLLKYKQILVEKNAVEEMDKHYHAVK
ncbi:MAG: 50S ribosomal protein L4 [Candidatus Colwellbacteria bacterium RIFCSPHIGHO2_02_FULL_45_17]|uniref:Large ribosomal subunit protein uL4 n=3 Tax=Parcubacteria group TaxID=1794811 RepID=A0A0H4T476_9BACT|nr:50S ribosomal protein L4, large subunit ribosomal protein L4 [uncultured Parcubacteria bacterium Rifle_16ft_4_minimus_37647]OGY58597.1 MAG: 50S ribosomal protein L4 [Candidatus Colwellbacteria bacterium RIFCSPHIGHO2_02_FULL_45_17]OGY61692.1 MAG: 50S ribosomal protein L4 [Candidatus Colwellbacteria bacterium RIFCSPLOWO2_02_FULL_45_11]OGY62736.1 MAG: 50S ribosomal protein L4 [Candidatus Colwellbacteria bacterium RIFCSPLOWO2_12_FULL_46_17]